MTTSYVEHFKFNVYVFHAQLVGNSTTIEQHATEDICTVNPTKTHYGSCLISNKDIIVWRNHSHNFQDLHSLRTFEVQRSGIYLLIPSLSAGGTEKRNAIQLDNGLILQLKNSKTDFISTLSNIVKEYSKKIGDDVGCSNAISAHYTNNHTAKRDDDTRMGKNMLPTD